jgi:hypothetical protein
MAAAEPTGRDLVPGFAGMVTAGREAMGRSMAELARQAGLPVNPVGAIEREVRAPSLRVAPALVVALGLRGLLAEPAKPLPPVAPPGAAGAERSSRAVTR